MKILIRCLVALTLVSFFAAIATIGMRLIPTEDSDVRLLADVRMFAIGGVGEAGRTSEGEILLRRILDSPSAPDRLQAVFVRGTPEGMAYALVGLKSVSAEHYGQAALRFRMWPIGRVECMDGCFVQSRSRTAIVRAIDDRRFSIEDKKDNQTAQPGATDNLGGA